MRNTLIMVFCSTHFKMNFPLIFIFFDRSICRWRLLRRTCCQWWLTGSLPCQINPCPVSRLERFVFLSENRDPGTVFFKYLTSWISSEVCGLRSRSASNWKPNLDPSTVHYLREQIKITFLVVTLNRARWDCSKFVKELLQSPCLIKSYLACNRCYCIGRLVHSLIIITEQRRYIKPPVQYGTCDPAMCPE